MALTPFTSNDDVRGLLGVSDEEMADAVLDLAVYSQGLLRELRKIDIGLPALFTTVDAIPALDRTPEQGALHEAVQFFSTHAAALQAGAPLGLIAPKRLTDDKASFERFADSPYRDVLARLSNSMADARRAVEEALAALNNTTVVASVLGVRHMVAVPRSYDPVTGA